jgi:hypothetical protein
VLPTYSNSISVQLLQRGNEAGARNPRDLWKANFSSDKPLMSGARKSGTPRKIDGLGDEAYWIGDERMGALNVLHGNRSLTVSVGGGGDQETKIKKCGEVARMILGRLR